MAAPKRPEVPEVLDEVYDGPSAAQREARRPSGRLTPKRDDPKLREALAYVAWRYTSDDELDETLLLDSPEVELIAHVWEMSVESVIRRVILAS